MFWILVMILAICLVTTIPIAISISIATIFGFLLFYSDMAMLDLLAQATVTAADSFPLLAVPFFMLMGVLMGKSGIAETLINFSEIVTKKISGGLGMSVILASIFFAAISGSGPAVVAALGAITIPSMVKRNYEADYGGALVASSSVIGIVIPPSIPLIMFGVVAGVSISQLFAAGIIPGLLMGLGLIIANYFITRKKDIIDNINDKENVSLLKALWNTKWTLLLPVVILGGIYTGIFTPTESAVVGVFYALILSFLEKSLNWKILKESLIESVLLSSIVMFVIGGAVTFGRLLTLERIPQQMAETMLNISGEPIIVLIMIMIFLIVIGMFMDATSSVVLFTPLFVPIILELGYDPIYFGVLMVVNLSIGLITPPLGMNIFVAQGVAKVPFESIVVKSIPFILVLLVVLLLLILFPTIVTFLPDLLY